MIHSQFPFSPSMSNRTIQTWNKLTTSCRILFCVRSRWSTLELNLYFIILSFSTLRNIYFLKYIQLVKIQLPFVNIFGNVTFSFNFKINICRLFKNRISEINTLFVRNETTSDCILKFSCNPWWKMEYFLQSCSTVLYLPC